MGDAVPEVNNTITITGAEVDIAFAGFADRYGADSIVDIHFNLTDLHDFTSSEAN